MAVPCDGDDGEAQTDDVALLLDTKPHTGVILCDHEQHRRAEAEKGSVGIMQDTSGCHKGVCHRHGHKGAISWPRLRVSLPSNVMHREGGDLPAGHGPQHEATSVGTIAAHGKTTAAAVVSTYY